MPQPRRCGRGVSLPPWFWACWPWTCSSSIARRTSRASGKPGPGPRSGWVWRWFSAYMRGIMIGAGVELLHHFSWLEMVFGGILLLTGVKMFFTGDESYEPSKTLAFRLTRKYVPLTDQFHGERFFVREQGKWLGTPALPARRAHLILPAEIFSALQIRAAIRRIRRSACPNWGGCRGRCRRGRRIPGGRVP